MTPHDLANQWRAEAHLFDRYADTRMATVCRQHASDLEAALRSEADDVLDLATASKESNYSVDRLRHMIADGAIPNAGGKGKPRIRRGDLPMKRRATGNGFDAAATASNLLSR